MPAHPQTPPFYPKLQGSLPPDFTWGYATAAAQIEGAWNEDGRGPSIWDTFTRLPGKIKDGSTPSDACNAYHLWKEDVARMKEYGARAYRFSLSWSRIVPLGGEADPVNEAGVEFYSNLIDELIRNEITPWVTLYHWDLPQALYDSYGGMLDKERYTADFMRYARLCFERFGDRVKYWITYNEPGLTARAGYAQGRNAPGHVSDTEPWIVGHTELVSHGYVCEMYKRDFQPTQNGCIMITLDGNWYEPWDENDPKDIEAAERAKEFEIGWFADPVYGKGDYPASMRAQLGERLPRFTKEEKRVVRGSSEVYGMNSYTAFYARHLDGVPVRSDYRGNVEFLNENCNGKPRGPETDTHWLRMAPWGWAKLLRWIWARYGVPICITENGTTVKGEHEGPAPAAPGEIVEDPFRAEFFRAYLAEVAKACQEGVVIKSYFAWSFLDNWEWALGYTSRFGVTWVDYASPQKTRYAKRSAYALREYFEFLIAQ
ncbi:glycoside hydrolase superfamily [Aspergillus keveii]|uniref:Glycoside hydrolase superfamily n=1 Tax=Aspergillus keveii TaxID=714993 RepID=A0ABR4FN70_9EURO